FVEPTKTEPAAATGAEPTFGTAAELCQSSCPVTPSSAYTLPSGPTPKATPPAEAGVRSDPPVPSLVRQSSRRDAAFPGDSVFSNGFAPVWAAPNRNIGQSETTRTVFCAP